MLFWKIKKVYLINLLSDDEFKIQVIANIAEDYQKSLSTAMETIYSVKDVLDSDTHEVTVESLDSIIHTPAVLIRKIE